jgi:hypothetical protein
MAAESPLRLVFQAREEGEVFCEQNIHPKLARKCEIGVLLLLLEAVLLEGVGALDRRNMYLKEIKMFVRK